MWPGYGENLRALLWLLDYGAGKVKGTETPIGAIPTPAELNLDGCEVSKADLDRLLHVDVERWRRELVSREEYLSQFPGLPEEIWEAHRRMAAALG